MRRWSSVSGAIASAPGAASGASGCWHRPNPAASARRMMLVATCLRASNRTPRGRDGADLVAGQGATAKRMGDQCAKPERHRHATRDARPSGLRLGPSSAASRLLAVPDPGTSPSPLLSATRPEAQRGSRGALLEALRANLGRGHERKSAMACLRQERGTHACRQRVCHDGPRQARRLRGGRSWRRGRSGSGGPSISCRALPRRRWLRPRRRAGPGARPRPRSPGSGRPPG